MVEEKGIFLFGVIVFATIVFANSIAANSSFDNSDSSYIFATESTCVVVNNNNRYVDFEVYNLVIEVDDVLLDVIN